MQVISFRHATSSFLQQVVERGPGRTSRSDLKESLQLLRSLQAELHDLASRRDQLNLAGRLLELETASFPELQQVL